MKNFATIVEEVKELSMEEKSELSLILDRLVIEGRREEIAHHHLDTLAELENGKLKFYTSTADLFKALNED